MELLLKMDESILNIIASVYVFNNTSDFGFYNSYRNFCLKNIVRLDFTYGSKEVKVYSTPEEYVLSDSKSNEIKSLFNKYYPKLHKIDQSEIDNLKKYFLIIFVNGEKEYYSYNDEFNEIFSCDKSDAISSKPNVVSTPYLKFENSHESYKYKIINDIGVNLRNKNFSSIYSYLSDDCVVNYNQLRISGLNELKREIKNRCGFFNYKLKKVNFYNCMKGYLNNGASEVCLEIDFVDKNYKTIKYLLYFQFNVNNLIENINIKPLDESIHMKSITGDNLKDLLNSRYDD